MSRYTFQPPFFLTPTSLPGLPDEDVEEAIDEVRQTSWLPTLRDMDKRTEIDRYEKESMQRMQDYEKTLDERWGSSEELPSANPTDIMAWLGKTWARRLDRGWKGAKEWWNAPSGSTEPEDVQDTILRLIGGYIGGPLELAQYGLGVEEPFSLEQYLREDSGVPETHWGDMLSNAGELGEVVLPATYYGAKGTASTVRAGKRGVEWEKARRYVASPEYQARVQALENQVRDVQAQQVADPSLDRRTVTGPDVAMPITGRNAASYGHSEIRQSPGTAAHVGWRHLQGAEISSSAADPVIGVGQVSGYGPLRERYEWLGHPLSEWFTPANDPRLSIGVRPPGLLEHVFNRQPVKRIQREQASMGGTLHPSEDVFAVTDSGTGQLKSIFHRQDTHRDNPSGLPPDIRALRERRRQEYIRGYQGKPPITPTQPNKEKAFKKMMRHPDNPTPGDPHGTMEWLRGEVEKVWKPNRKRIKVPDVISRSIVTDGLARRLAEYVLQFREPPL